MPMRIIIALAYLSGFLRVLKSAVYRLFLRDEMFCRLL